MTVSLTDSDALAGCLDSSPDAIALLDGEGRVMACNRAFREWRQEPEFGRGRPLAELMTSESRRGFQKIWSQLVEMTQGRRFPVRFLGENLRDLELLPLGDGQVLAVVRPARGEDEELILDPQFIQTQKMETIGRLAGGLAHSFNNTLMGIIGYCELALMDVGSDEPVHGHLQTIRQIGEKAAELTKQLLAYSRKQQLEISSVPIGQLVSGLAPVIQHWLGDRVALDIECADTWPVLADNNQLEQVLMNLVINARDAMPEGGRLAIKTRDFHVDENLADAFPGLKPGHYGLLMVCDSGSGMNPEVLDNIFEPFFTTKERGRGTGLGLATVYGVVKQHNGYIGVASAEGIGSTFKVLIPAAAPVAEPEPFPADFTGREFLLLTHDRAWTHYCAKLLRDAGAVVHLGWNALVRMKRNPGTGGLHFDAVFSDDLQAETERGQLLAAGVSLEACRWLCVTDLCALLSKEQERSCRFLPKLLSRDETLKAIAARLAGAAT